MPGSDAVKNGMVMVREPPSCSRTCLHRSADIVGYKRLHGILFLMSTRPVITQQPRLFGSGMLIIVLMCVLFSGNSLGGDDAIFQQFTQHIGRQIHKDKQAFAQANTCVLWFYKGGKTHPPTVQGIGWNPTPSSQVEADCLRHYPR